MNDRRPVIWPCPSSMVVCVCVCDFSFLFFSRILIVQSIVWKYSSKVWEFSSIQRMYGLWVWLCSWSILQNLFNSVQYWAQFTHVKYHYNQKAQPTNSFTMVAQDCNPRSIENDDCNISQRRRREANYRSHLTEQREELNGKEAAVFFKCKHGPLK